MRKKAYLTQQQLKISELELKRFHKEKKLRRLLELSNMELYYLT